MKLSRRALFCGAAAVAVAPILPAITAGPALIGWDLGRQDSSAIWISHNGTIYEFNGKVERWRSANDWEMAA